MKVTDTYPGTRKIQIQVDQDELIAMIMERGMDGGGINAQTYSTSSAQLKAVYVDGEKVVELEIEVTGKQ